MARVHESKPNYRIDLVGPWDRGLTKALRAFAGTMLPMGVHKLNKSFDPKENTHTLSFVLGAKKLSHARVDSLLDDLGARASSYSTFTALTRIHHVESIVGLGLMYAGHIATPN